MGHPLSSRQQNVIDFLIDDYGVKRDEATAAVRAAESDDSEMFDDPDEESIAEYIYTNNTYWSRDPS